MEKAKVSFKKLKLTKEEHKVSTDTTLDRLVNPDLSFEVNSEKKGKASPESVMKKSMIAFSRSPIKPRKKER